MTKDIETIIRKMTLEEKASLCIGATAWTTVALDHLGVPEMFVSDGPHGIRKVPETGSLGAQSLPATCFPTASAVASSWDTSLIAEMGEAIAEEAIALGVNVVLGPGVNMKRSPLCGRNFEYFSEDPFLAGEMSASFIRAVQSKGVGTSLKHYAANNQEYQRFTINAVVDERTLREIYLPAFEKAVKEAKPWTVMCAYNRLNGPYCSEHEVLLTKILKEEWGFEGLVVSDWGAVRDRVAALAGGLDLEMPGPQPRRVQAVVQAVKNGVLSESRLDDAVRRILRIVFMAAQTPKGSGTYDAGAHHRLARKIAAESMVLLKNSGILPLRNITKLALIGNSAKEAYFQGGGSSHINPTQVDVPFDEVAKLAKGAQLTYAQGYLPVPGFDQKLIDEAAAAAKAAEAALLFLALPAFKESEGYDRADLELTDQQVALIHAVTEAQPNTVVILNNGSAVAMSGWIHRAAAVLEGWMMGQAGGGAIADILFGVVNPSGKISETFPLRLEDTPAYLNFPGELGNVRYGEGIFIGYRYYDSKNVPVLFPFGYGLSYTNIEYSNLRTAATTFSASQGLTLWVDITNTGKMAGKEVVQLYVRDPQSKLVRPFKELKGFVKVHLQPGETKTVQFHLDERAFAYYHVKYQAWVAEPGEFELLVGASAADVRLKATVTLESERVLPSLLNRESTIREWLEDPRGKIVFEPMFQAMGKQMGATLGAGEEEGGIGMEMMGFLMEMPLASVLHFQQASLPAEAVEIVDGLLAQIRSIP